MLAAALVQIAWSFDNSAMRLVVDSVPLSMTTKAGVVAIRVEIAQTPLQRARGLMFRERLRDGQGMLFIFEQPDFQNFWMKNTPQPLDLIFIDTAGTVVSVQQGEPNSTTPIPSQGLVRFVLELAAGEAERLGIAKGNAAAHPALNSVLK